MGGRGDVQSNGYEIIRRAKGGHAMAFTRTIRGEAFRNTSLILTGIRFESCTFILCQLIYDGDEAFAFDNCTFFECEWTFDGPAENTLVFLSALYNGLGEEGRQLVESVFNS